MLNLLNTDNNGKKSGIMIPIPQYPLYSATLAEYGMHQINYYLDEDNEWALSIKELQRSLDESRKVCEPRGLVVINPGNPTGEYTSSSCLATCLLSSDVQWSKL